jgi:CubicO group peptidase (beta-lactamase class C family)
VTLNEGGSTLTAETRAIVRDGRIAAIEIVKPGAGYQRAPVVTIEGGRLGGSDARGVARIANGIVVEIKVVDGGSGYLPSLTVWVEPGEPTSNAIPIWAPAGALSSTVEDMARFAAAALGASQVDGRPVPLVLRQGFRVAQTAWACTGESPSLASCPAGVTRAGFAWAIRPADLTNRVPEIIVKDGLLGGYSSQIMLARSRKLAVVVLANNATGPEDAPAPHVAANMLYHLLSALPK